MAATKKTPRKSSAGTNVVVLGGGLIGSVIASDLASSRGMKVTVADSSGASLKNCIRRATRKIDTVEADLSDAEDIARVVGGGRSRRRRNCPAASV